MNSHHHHINYIELASSDLNASKAFFSAAFGWAFIDYGAQYVAFDKATTGLDGGLYLSQGHTVATTSAGDYPVLMVLFSDDLELSLTAAVQAGAQVTKAIFDFPGGRRFEAIAPGNVPFAVWAEPSE